MKILVICPFLPSKDARGYQILAFKRLEYLSKNHSIHLICFQESNSDLYAKKNLESLGIVVQLVKLNIVEICFNCIKAIFNTEKPIQCAMFKSSKLENAIDYALNNVKPNLIYAISIRIAENIILKNYPLAFDIIDSLTLNISRRIDQANRIYKTLLRFELSRINKYEKKISEISDLSFVVSAIDKKIIANDKIIVLPLGVTIPDSDNKVPVNSEPVILFTGNMYYEPNISAILWFYKNCWSRLKALIPTLSLVIAGSKPAQSIQNLIVDNNIKVTGQINSMVEVIKSSHVCIAPMQSGSGMQFKILEAMACGIPVLTTSLGLGDIGAKNGINIMVADTPDKFISVLVYLLTNSDYRRRIGSAGLSFVKQFHNWKSINMEFERVLCEKFDSVN